MSDSSLVKATLTLPCSVVILSAGDGDSQGAMTATAMYVSQDPPLVAVSVSKTFATYQLIEKSKAFAINVIADDQLDLARKFGRAHGFEIEKYSEFKVATEPADKIGARLISGCFANIECRVKSSLWDVEGNHALYIGEVVAYRARSECRPTVWLNNRYYSVGAECAAGSD